MNRTRELLTDAEVRDLLSPRQRRVLEGVDPWFGVRNLVVLLITLFFGVRIVLLPEAVVGQFAGVDHDYVLSHLRAWLVYMLAMVALYFYSYLRDWHFDRVVTLLFAAAFSGFVMDVVQLYVYIAPQATVTIWVGLVLRVLGLWLLGLNMLRSARRPPMPRSLFGPWPWAAP